MLKSIVATFECDGCSRVIPIDIDPADATRPAVTFFDEAERRMGSMGIVKDAGLHFCVDCDDALNPLVEVDRQGYAVQCALMQDEADELEAKGKDWYGRTGIETGELDVSGSSPDRGVVQDAGLVDGVSDLGDR